MQSIIKNHKFFICFYLLIQALSVWQSVHFRELLLINADWNHINIINMVSHPEWFSILDDFESGQSKNHIIWSSSYFYVGYLIGLLGVPSWIFVILHQLLGAPLLYAGVYYICWSFFREQYYALFGTALFFFMDFWIFSLNIGYPILFGYSIYYGDVSHIVAVFIVGFLLDKKMIHAGICVGILATLNVTYGLNALILLVGWQLIPMWGKESFKVKVSAVGIASVMFVCQALLITLGFEADPAPEEARIAAIHSYGHISIHAYSFKFYCAALGALLLYLFYSLIFEKQLRHYLSDEGVSNYHVRTNYLMILVTLIWAIILYWILYVYWPQYFPTFSPSKWLMILSFYLTPYIAASFISLFKKNYLVALSFLGVIIIFPFLQFRGDKFLLNPIFAGIMISSIFLSFRPTPFSKTTIKRILAFSSLFFLATYFSQSMNQLKSVQMKKARDLYEISIQIDNELDQNVLFVPIGIFNNLALRTFSHRSYIPYWQIGRNAYFNSMTRHRIEELGHHSATGSSLWQDVLPHLAKIREDEPFCYYTGMCRGQMRKFWAPVPSVLLTAEKRKELVSALANMTMDEAVVFAEKMGGSHIFLPNDVKYAKLLTHAILKNESYAVIPVNAVSM